MKADLTLAQQKLKRSLEEKAFIRASNEKVVSQRGVVGTTSGWLFDLRRILLEPETMEAVAELFWDTFPDKSPLQIGGLETGAIPLLSNLVAHATYIQKRSDVSGFFVRKSRKKYGLTRMIEGVVHEQKQIVLVDDLINSGQSFIRQVEVLESLGHRITALWSIVRFREESYYRYFAEKNISIFSVFELDDFSDTLRISNLPTTTPPSPPKKQFEILWKFASPNPSYHMVAPKSAPAIDDTHVYVGSDIGVMWALNQSDGSTAWSHTIGFHRDKKGIFSSPAVHSGVVYFGGYDGNMYALDAKTGMRKWVSFEADWIGSSPALAPELGVLFIGLEYGMFAKRGGIAALDIHTGKTAWSYRAMPCLTHSSPRYIPEHQQVVIGSNDGVIYLFDALKGTLLWRHEPGQLTDKELYSGFSRYDIKESFGYDHKRDLIVSANIAGDVLFLKRTTGVIVGSFKTEFGVFSTPIIDRDSVLVSSVDKNLYCLSLDTFQEKWRWYAGARIFATPTIIEDKIYLGANTGRLTVINPETGRSEASLTLPERITNRPVYNPVTKRFFVPTFANEIYCVERCNDLDQS